jgi:hypothetical protein
MNWCTNELGCMRHGSWPDHQLVSPVLCGAQSPPITSGQRKAPKTPVWRATPHRQLKRGWLHDTRKASETHLTRPHLVTRPEDQRTMGSGCHLGVSLADDRQCQGAPAAPGPSARAPIHERRAAAVSMSSKNWAGVILRPWLSFCWAARVAASSP